MVYVYKENEDIQIIPDLDMALEEFATKKIAARINSHNMCIAYHEAEKQPRHFEKIGDLGLVFNTYCDRVCENKRGAVGGLRHLINQFRDVHKWPILNEHYREGYSHGMASLLL